MTYEYYLFSQLFHCIIIDSEDWDDTPYDRLYPCIMQYYEHMEQEGKEIYYESIQDFLKENKKIITLALVTTYQCTKEEIVDKEPTVDLFEKYDTLPFEVRCIIDKYSNDGYAMNIEDMRSFEKELGKIGYEFEYGLDMIPFNLTKTDCTEEE